jgi:two-component system OmpR family response regulator
LLHATRVQEDIFDRSIDFQVWRLRRKIEVGMNVSHFIETVSGVGYVFVFEVVPF